MSSPYLSIVIPAYNEGVRIEAALDRVMTFIKRAGWDVEILVVDDGSRDDTASIVERYIKICPQLRLLKNPGNRGKGFSVRSGLLQAVGEIVMFTDADLSAPMVEVEQLISALVNGSDVAIGSRWLDRRLQTIQQPFYRRFFGRCFNIFTRTVLGLPFTDTQCGFKAFRRETAQAVLRYQTIERWGFDPELLFIAQRFGYKIVEIPVTWGHDERSQISYLKDGIKMLEEIMTIRYNSSVGRYDQVSAATKDADGMASPPVDPLPKIPVRSQE
jgi:glycosyltransferase involved in cell wall biosynthesis